MIDFGVWIGTGTQVCGGDGDEISEDGGGWGNDSVDGMGIISSLCHSLVCTEFPVIIQHIFAVPCSLDVLCHSQCCYTLFQL